MGCLFGLTSLESLHPSCWEFPSYCQRRGCCRSGFVVIRAFPSARSDRARWIAALMHREKEKPDTTPKGGTGTLEVRPGCAGLSGCARAFAGGGVYPGLIRSCGRRG